MDRYKIVRFYHPSLGGTHKRPRTIKTGVSLEEAQRHCNDPKTRKDGVYFDGYTKSTIGGVKWGK